MQDIIKYLKQKYIRKRLINNKKKYELGQLIQVFVQMLFNLIHGFMVNVT